MFFLFSHFGTQQNSSSQKGQRVQGTFERLKKPIESRIHQKSRNDLVDCIYIKDEFFSLDS